MYVGSRTCVWRECVRIAACVGKGDYLWAGVGGVCRGRPQLCSGEKGALGSMNQPEKTVRA